MDSVERLIGGTNREYLIHCQVAGEDMPPDAPRLPPATTKRARRPTMAYGLSTRAFIEEGPVVQVAKADALRSTARSWRVLSEACRLAAIEQALDRIPIAL